MRRILLLLVLWLIYQIFSGLWGIWRLYTTSRALEADISRFRALEAYYRFQDELYNDPSWIEYIARERLAMVRPRERFIRIIPEK